MSATSGYCIVTFEAVLSPQNRAMCSPQTQLLSFWAFFCHVTPSHWQR